MSWKRNSEDSSDDGDIEDEIDMTESANDKSLSSSMPSAEKKRKYGKGLSGAQIP